MIFFFVHAFNENTSCLLNVIKSVELWTHCGQGKCSNPFSVALPFCDTQTMLRVMVCKWHSHCQFNDWIGNQSYALWYAKKIKGLQNKNQLIFARLSCCLFSLYFGYAPIIISSNWINRESVEPFSRFLVLLVRLFPVWSWLDTFHMLSVIKWQWSPTFDLFNFWHLIVVCTAFF